MIVFFYIILYIIIICTILLFFLLISNIKIKLEKLQINEIIKFEDEIKKIKMLKSQGNIEISKIIINEILKKMKFRVTIEIDVLSILPIFYISIDNKKIIKIINKSKKKNIKNEIKNSNKLAKKIRQEKKNKKGKADSKITKKNYINNLKNNNKLKKKNARNLALILLENAKLEDFNMVLKFGMADAEYTAIVIGYLNLILNLAVAHFNIDINNYYYKTVPIYSDKNIVFLDTNLIFSINIFNILNKISINGNNIKS